MERRKSKSMIFEINTEEFDMSFDLSFNEREQKDKREKRIEKIVEQYSKLSPEMQEAVFEFGESLIKEGKSGGQGPVT